MRCNVICIVGIPEGVEREQGIEDILEETTTENFHNLVREKRLTSPRSSESPEQVGHKEVYTETHHI